MPDDGVDGHPAVLGYITSRFPAVTETFIVRELDAVRELGHRVQLYPLRRQRQTVEHPSARAWAEVASWTGRPGLLLRAHIAACAQDPATYLGVWRTVAAHYGRNPLDLLRASYVVAKAVPIARLVRRDGVQHVHAHYATHPALAGWVVRQLSGVPYSVTVHAHDIQLRNRMLRQKLMAADAVVAVSEQNRRTIGRLVGGDLLPRVAVVHCGVDASRYSGLTSSSLGNPRRITAVGSLQEYKGHTHLIEAIRLLRTSGTDVRLTIVGAGRLETVLRRQVIAAGLTAHVRFAGALNEHGVQAALAHTDCFVQPSIIAATGQTEGIPVALMEAMAAGIPVVATEVSGVPELVRDGVTGLLVPPGQSPALAAAIVRVFADRKGSRRRCAAARKLVQEEFDLLTNARRLSEIFAASSCSGRVAS